MHRRNIKTQDIDVVILCGGLGTRLQNVLGERPKPMVEINGRPFLDILIDYMAKFGFYRFILCIGYKGDFIRRHYEKKSRGLIFLISEEERPLGTAGAIKNTESFIESDIFLVLNGDSLCEIDMEDFLSFHVKKKGSISIALTAIKNSMDFLVVRLNRDQKIIGFSEKIMMHEEGLVNAGIYCFDRKTLKEIPPGEKRSLEYDLFPGVLDKGIYGYVTEKKLLDIGTPERLEIAKEYFRETKR